MIVSVGIRDFPYIDRIADVSVDNSIPETFCYGRFGSEKPFATFDSIVQRVRSGYLRNFAFDTERIKYSASKHFIIHNPELNNAGEVIPGFFEDYRHFISIRQKGDFNTLVHELIHVANNLYPSYNLYERDEDEIQMYEDAIEIGSRIIVGRFPNLLDDIRSLQINAVMDLMQKYGVLGNPEKVMEFKEWYERERSYNERRSLEEKVAFKMILNNYFWDELMSALQNGRPALPPGQLWLF